MGPSIFMRRSISVVFRETIFNARNKCNIKVIGLENCKNVPSNIIFFFLLSGPYSMYPRFLNRFSTLAAAFFK